MSNLKGDISKLLKYGFIKKDNYYEYEKVIVKDKFKIIVTYKDEKLEGKVIDINTLEEYILVKVKDASGDYVGKIRDLYNEVINDITKNCFHKEAFKFKQTKEVLKYLKEKYDVEPEFLWDDDLNAALRHKDNLKWFGVMMTVSQNKLGFKNNELVEIIDLKINPLDLEKIVDMKNYLPGYHMNKKHWITIILDGRVNNKIIFKLIDDSFKMKVK